jgi:membrane protein
MATENRTRRFRGRSAKQPRDIPLKGWRDIAFRVKADLADNHISIVAAGIAFYALLAIFPALVAMVSIYGLVGDPADIQWQFSALGRILPIEVRMLLSEQLRRITARAPTTLSVGFSAGVVVALWGAVRGMKAFIIALNIVYGEKEKRDFLELHARALVLILGAIVLIALALALIVILPILLSYLDLPKGLKALFSLLPWLLLAGNFMLSLAVLYRYGPSRSEPQWQWVSWGAVAATLLWVIGSALFSFYVANFGRYDQTYGSLGALVILVIWLFGTAYIILLGAEFNAEIERQAKIVLPRGNFDR